MAIYLGERNHSRAAITALKLNYARIAIINPLLKAQYPSKSYEAKHVVGVDKSDLYAVKTGVRGDNDLVWVGRSANHAAKLSSLSTEAPSWITGEVYDMLADDAKFSNGRAMWESKSWAGLPGRRLYSSTWNWTIH
jgi:class 3 adenylate cyclase